jgi:hypothetical protein
MGMSRAAVKVYCAFCWMEDGIRSESMKGWDGAPLCREHVAETIARSSGQPVIESTVDRSYQSLILH